MFLLAVAQWAWQHWVLTPDGRRPRPALRHGTRLGVGAVLTVLVVALPFP